MTPFAKGLLRWGGADDPQNAVPAAELAKAGYTAKDARGRTVLTEAGADKWRDLASTEGWDAAGSDPDAMGSMDIVEARDLCRNDGLARYQGFDVHAPGRLWAVFGPCRRWHAFTGAVGPALCDLPVPLLDRLGPQRGRMCVACLRAGTDAG